MERIIYKFVTKANWSAFLKSGATEFKGFDNDLTDGFIHLSTHENLYKTFIKKNKESDKNKFKLLAIDLILVDDIRWGKSSNGVMYPRAYSNLEIDHSILWILDMDNYQFDANGL
jgi:uncharacterized protein (DUF952 family)